MRDLDWRVVRELLALRAHFREFFERALLPSSPPALSATALEPAADVWESDSELVVELELPGVSRSAVTARLEDTRLVVSGTFPDPPGTTGTFLRLERPRGPFQRVITLPSPVRGTPAATLRAGVLEVRMDKEAPGRRRIPVEPEAP